MHEGGGDAGEGYGDANEMNRSTGYQHRVMAALWEVEIGKKVQEI